ncbi:MAG: PASTA domain-containing protein [Bacilli bacterium]|nr:PASTA domain-containing protein [Bacilli bacterium]
MCSDKLHQGGGVAAPVASKILAEVLPYLEVSKDNVSSEDIKVSVDVPNIVGLTYKDAKSVLKEVGLEMVFRNEEGENKISEDFVISNQVPSSGVQILEGGTIIVE